MKHTEEPTHIDRSWDSIQIKLVYGYFAEFAPVSLTCNGDGELIFKTEYTRGLMHIENAIDDWEHSISKKSLVKLDDLVAEIAAIESLEGTMVMDGSSFECTVHLSNGKVTGFHYVSMILNEKFKNLETRLRELLREDFFLKKHKNKLLI